MKQPLLIALCVALSACADTKPGAPKAAPPRVAVAVAKPAPAPDTMAPAILPAAPVSVLAEGIALYEKGDYNGAVKKLAVANVATAPKATQLSALKYTAFSYCLTSRQALCRQQFEKALKIDASFDLEPGEKGHPMWWPAWLKAKKGKV
ncbi:TssQ family T6SS-associated lipoprotein [Massilia sp. S19_KUP03_FR1]|uniref:TssQ family T6SS-associated lipoprotein n=1 Tax=Massilia sp. S19_KUP03_FR1 TaxID=3025503 RepID=UPI002FCD8C3B